MRQALIPAKLPVDWELKKVDEVTRILDDIPVCRNATARIQWVNDGGELVPALILEFAQFANGVTVPAFGVRLTTKPSNTPIEGDKLKKHIRDGVEKYLRRNGIVLELADDEVKVVVNG